MKVLEQISFILANDVENVKLLFLGRTGLVCIPCPSGRHFCTSPLAGVGCERMFGTRRFWAGWSWTAGAEGLGGSWTAGLAQSPGKPRLGLRQVSWQAPDLQRSKTGPERRRKTASEKTASQMENQFREQEATDQNGKPPEWKRKWNQERNETSSLKPKQSLLLLTFQGVSVDLRWICSEQHDSSINKEFWEHADKTQTLKGDNSGEIRRTAIVQSKTFGASSAAEYNPLRYFKRP